MPHGYIEPERAAELERLAERFGEAKALRDKAIWEAWSAGISLRTIAEHVGMTHAGVRNTAMRIEDVREGREPLPSNWNYPAGDVFDPREW